MSISNPYSTPVVQGKKRSSGGGSGGGSAIEPLRKTRPWVIFLAILGFINSLFVVGGAVIVMISPAPDDVENGGLVKIIAASIMLVSGLLYGIPSFLLVKYGMAIGEFLEQPNSENLSRALSAQMSFWRLIGMVTAIVLGLFVGLIVLALILGVSAAAMSS
jgi:hypothetical protein